MFHPSEVELAETTQADSRKTSTRLKPTRLVFDSLSELRLLAGNALRYRRQILALKQFFATRALHGAAARRPDGDRPRPADAEHRARRRAARSAESASTAPSAAGCGSLKYRGVQFRGGYHDYVDPTRRHRGVPAARRGGASAHRRAPQAARATSRQLDSLLGGGIEEGTSTLVVGAAGTGKSTLAAQFVAAAADARRRAARCSCSTRPRTPCSRAARRSAWISRAHIEAGSDRRCSKSIQRSSPRASSSTQIAPRGRATA